MSMSDNKTAVTTKPALKGCSLMRALCKFNNCPPYQLNARLSMHYTQNLDFIQNLGPLFVDYSEDHSKIAVNSISSLSAEDQPAFGDHRSKTSVEQFIFSKYKRTLNYSHLFCVVEYGGVQKKTGFVHCNYYPIECLRYQKFTTNSCNKKPKNTKEIIDLSGELMEKVVISTGSSTVEIKIE